MKQIAGSPPPTKRARNKGEEGWSRLPSDKHWTFRTTTVLLLSTRFEDEGEFLHRSSDVLFRLGYQTRVDAPKFSGKDDPSVSAGSILLNNPNNRLFLRYGGWY
jgi:hypothetical protein